MRSGAFYALVVFGPELTLTCLGMDGFDGAQFIQLLRGSKLI
jgi:hypothetical protein